MTRLLACYPAQRFDEVQWPATVAAYFDALGHMRPDAIRWGFDWVWREFPNWFPSCGQLRLVICKAPPLREHRNELPASDESGGDEEFFERVRRDIGGANAG